MLTQYCDANPSEFSPGMMNSSSAFSQQLGATATLKCALGYNISYGSLTVACLAYNEAHGNWSVSSAVCSRTSCFAISDI